MMCRLALTLQAEALRDSLQRLLSGPPVKLLPVTLTGRLSKWPHTFLVRLTVAPEHRSMHFLDSCTSNAEVNTEREEALASLRGLLSRSDPGWAGVEWAEWDGWDGGTPQQTNNGDCALLTWFNATQLAAKAERGEPPPLPEQITLRGEAALLILLYIINDHHPRGARLAAARGGEAEASAKTS